MIEREAQRLLRVVELLLDLGKLRSGTLELSVREEPLGDIARSVVTALEESAQIAGIEIRYRREDEPTLSCDADRVERILFAGVSTLMREAPRGSAIEIRIIADDARATIHVQCDGCDPSAERDPATDDGHGDAPFHTSSRGLEIAPEIAQQLATAQGGTLEFTPGHATFVLPSQPPVASAATAATAATADAVSAPALPRAEQ